MQFIDQARIAVKAGRGGDGIVAFRREKYVPAGGPSGGDGGRGADVLLLADSNLQTLLDFKYKRIFEATDGRRGGPNRCTGASGDPLVIKVPCGTEVRDTRTIFDIGINPNRPPVLKHHALEDAWNQAVGVQNVYKKLRTASSINGELFQPLAHQR